jgi:hypothetical protein
MKFVVGVVIGVVLIWLYRSDRARAEARSRLEATPDWLRQTGRTAASAAVLGAQWVSEAVDAAPLPPIVKTTASDAAFNVWAAGETLTQDPSKETNPVTGATDENNG